MVVHRAQGIAFIAASTLATGLFGGRDYCIFYTWLDPQRTRYAFSYDSPWTPARLVHALEGVIFFAARLWGGTCTGHSGRHHRPPGVGVVLAS